MILKETFFSAEFAFKWMGDFWICILLCYFKFEKKWSKSVVPGSHKTHHSYWRMLKKIFGVITGAGFWAHHATGLSGRFLTSDSILTQRIFSWARDELKPGLESDWTSRTRRAQIQSAHEIAANRTVARFNTSCTKIKQSVRWKFL